MTKLLITDDTQNLIWFVDESLVVVGGSFAAPSPSGQARGIGGTLRLFFCSTRTLYELDLTTPSTVLNSLAIPHVSPNNAQDIGGTLIYLFYVNSGTGRIYFVDQDALTEDSGTLLGIGTLVGCGGTDDQTFVVTTANLGFELDSDTHVNLSGAGISLPSTVSRAIGGHGSGASAFLIHGSQGGTDDLWKLDTSLSTLLGPIAPPGATTLGGGGVKDAPVDSPALKEAKRRGGLYLLDGGPRLSDVVGPRPLWTPAQIKTQGWYDASDLSTITDSGGSVSQWDDKSGNGLHLSQGTGSAQPETGSEKINGLNALDFVLDFMKTASNPFGATINDAFVIAAYRVPTINNSILANLSGSAAAANRWSCSSPWTGGPAGAGRMFFDCGGVISGVTRVEESIWVAAGEELINSYYCSVTDSVQEVYKNGSFFKGDLTGHAVATIGNIIVGAFDAAGFFPMTNVLGEIVIINGTVDEYTRQRLQGYMAWKWGQESKLPVGHLYKNAPPST